MIPGLILSPGLLGDRKLTSLRLLTTRETGGPVHTLPSDIRRGDLIVIGNHRWSGATSTNPSTVVPSGFTSISNIAGSGRRRILSYKLADNNDAGRTISTMNGPVLMAIFRGNKPATNATHKGVTSTGPTDGNPSPRNVAASEGKAPLVVIGTYGTGGGNTVNPRTFLVNGVGAKDAELGGGEFWMAWKVFNKDPQDVVIDMNDNGDANSLQACYIEVE